VEIGIYLALGEKKINIVFQILIEIISISMIAILLALLFGIVFSTHLSQQLIRRDLEQQAYHEVMLGSTQISNPIALTMFNPGPMSVEDMVALYDTSLNKTTIILFFKIATITIAISTLIPLIYLTKINPKKILI